MWQESESRLSDFSRVSLLVRSQIRLSLADEASKSWLHLERDFLETDYRTIRDRQMETLEKEDGMLVKDSVRELRGKLHLEAQEVVNEQRCVFSAGAGRLDSFADLLKHWMYAPGCMVQYGLGECAGYHDVCKGAICKAFAVLAACEWDLPANHDVKMTIFQSPNRRSLAWADYPSRQSANPTYESLRERSKLANRNAL